MKVKWILWAGLLLLMVAGCDRKQNNLSAGGPPEMPPMPVAVVHPIAKEVTEWDEYQGWVEAVDTVAIRARVNGYLQSIHFKDGAEVKKGDLLFVIDPRPYKADLDRANADLLQAQTKYELASNDLARASRLLKARAISEEDADSRSKAERTASAGIQSALAAVEMSKLNMEYTEIRAPIDGRIGRKMMTEGNLVNGGAGESSLLATIVAQDPIYCRFDADERSILKYADLSRHGEHGNFGGGKWPVEIELANETGFPHKGVLDFVDNQVDPNTGTMRVRGKFSNPDRVLQPGFFARVRVPGSEAHQALLIPDLAVGSDQDQKFVLTTSSSNTVQYAPVKLGPIIDGMREVLGGLQTNDWIIIDGLMAVRPGSKIIPNPTNAAPVAVTQ